MTMPQRFDGEVVTAAEFERLRNMHDPLVQAVRELIDATVRSKADAAGIAAAATAVKAITESLRPLTEEHRWPVRHADTGRPLLVTSPAAGRRNPFAPLMVIQHGDDGRWWSDFTLGAVYEGPPGIAHGGVAALVLDHMLGEAATSGLTEPRYTGTISLRYLRSTPLGPLHVEAYVERIDGPKTYARGFISDADGPTVEAEGLFITPAWARESSE